jgi:protein-L-isoaspartate(D-aspartate) O-methyltransferase
MATEPDTQVYIDRLATKLKATGAIRSAAVERAFRAVPRHRLLERFSYYDGARPVMIDHNPRRPEPGHLDLIYDDTALATRREGGRPASSTSQPSMMARALELLDLRPGMRVLEIGAGTGYNAALMAELTGEAHLVTTVDIREDVVEQTSRLLAAAGYPGIRVRHGDGVQGAPADAPFDRIVATVGCSDLSPNWAAQLRDDGIMAIPLAHCGDHPLVLLRHQAGELRGRVALWTGFMPVRGPLHIEDLWPAGVVCGEQTEIACEPAPGPGFAFSRPDDEHGFLFYLGLHDRRALGMRDGIGLSAMLDGWAKLGPDGLSWWKNAGLARTLERLYQRWLAIGRPMASDFLLSFQPAGVSSARPPGGWVIERRFYRELATLGA